MFLLHNTLLLLVLCTFQVKSDPQNLSAKLQKYRASFSTQELRQTCMRSSSMAAPAIKSRIPTWKEPFQHNNAHHLWPVSGSWPSHVKDGSQETLGQKLNLEASLTLPLQRRYEGPSFSEAVSCQLQPPFPIPQPQNRPLTPILLPQLRFCSPGFTAPVPTNKQL